MTGLQVRPIKDYCLGIFDGPHATPKESDEGPVFLGIKNLTNDGRLNFTEIRHVSEQEFPRWTRRVTPQEGDVVFTYEATLHRYALIPEGFRGCLGRRVALVRPDPAQVDSRYLLYYFLSHQWRQVVEGSIISGATVDRVPLEKFPSFPAALPSLPAQREIASILSAYDNLIENNRRRMALLEEAARQLYREWFVRLRFPGHEHTRIIDGVPEGWERTTFGDLCDAVREVVMPEALDPDTPYIGLEHIPRRSIALSEWGTAEQVTSSKHRFAAEDVIFGKIRPYFHKVGIAFVDGVASSDAIVIRTHNPDHSGFVLMTASSDPFVAATSQTMREGSKMPRADWKQMQAYPAPLPPTGLLGSFEATIKPIVEQLKTLTFANQKLRTARDLLLPCLMSGEIAA